MFRSLFLVFFPLSSAVRDETDGGALQLHEANYLFEPILVELNGPVNPLVGKESRTGWLNYLISVLNSRPNVL